VCHPGWDAASTAPLVRAIASGSALPGVYPPITIGGQRYMDGGVRIMMNADLAAGHTVVIVVSSFAFLALTARGTKMLDAGLVHDAYRVGVRQSEIAADRLGAVWNA
jgi:NTE family protein